MDTPRDLPYNRPVEPKRLPAILPKVILAVIILATMTRVITSRSTPRNSGQESAIFREAAAETGLDFVHFNGAAGEFYLPEIMGSGAAFFDYDNDGDLDAYLVQGTTLGDAEKTGEALFPWNGSLPPRGRLFRNDLAVASDGSRKLHFTDVTEKSGLVARGYGMGASAGDINNDGFVDLYLTYLGSNQMLLNNGDGTFTDVTSKSQTDDPRWSSSAAFFDYDRDGWLDLFVANYVDFSTSAKRSCFNPASMRDYCSPGAYNPVPDRLFHNRGNGTFDDVSARAGIAREFGSGLGVVTADFNQDGWPDIFVANDGNANQLWFNQRDGTFKNTALLSGVAFNRDGKADAGMGVDAGDFNADGLEDLFLPHLMQEMHTLFVNLGNGLFEDATRQAGLAVQSGRYTGFGTALFDYDNDGWLDLLSANGAVYVLMDLARKGSRYPFGQPNQLFHNEANGRFVDVSHAAGAAFQLPEVSRGAAFGDVDNDGDVDVLISNNSGPARLYLNQVGNRNHWIGVSLLGGKNSRYMPGARVEIVRADGRTLWRRSRTDGSYCSSLDPRVLAGLGVLDRVEAVRVRWPSGKVEEWKGLPVDRYTILREGGISGK